MLPLALPAPYDYLVPQGTRVEPGQFVIAPLGPVEYLGVVWTRPEGAGPPDIKPEKLRAIIELIDDVPKLPRVSLDFADWVANYTLSSPGMVLRMMMSAGRAFSPPAPRYGVRLIGVPPSAHDAGKGTRDRGGIERDDLGEVEPRRGRRGEHGRDRRARGLRHAHRRAPARLACAPARYRPRARQAHAGAAGRRARASHQYERRLHRDPPRRRHRVGQDRSLFRGDRAGSRARAAGTRPHARNRAHQPVHRPLRGALRRQARRVAFRRSRAAARPRLAGGGREQGEARGRRALCPLSALPRSRPHRRR